MAVTVMTATTVKKTYAKIPPVWAVHYEYDHKTMKTTVTSVTRWNFDKDIPRIGVAKVYAKDELEAYMKVMGERN